MKRLLCIVVAMSASAEALATDVGVSVSIGQPGYYGRIDIGSIPQPPQLVYAQPIVVQPARIRVVQEPIYLRVPPGQAKHWSKHCRRYNACGQPVYFVQDTWYNNVYVPNYRRRHGYVAAPPPAYANAPPPAYAYAPPPAYAYAPPPERLYSVPVTSVRAVLGPPEQRCWVERQQVVQGPSEPPNVPGAIVGAVVGGVLGHQIGSGRGRDVATAGGAVAGAAIGATVGRGPAQVYGQDVQRCASVPESARPQYWDVTYNFRGVVHRVQLSAPPGRTLTVDATGAPRV
jgi:uncharacterized protein YcfJ